MQAVITPRSAIETNQEPAGEPHFPHPQLTRSIIGAAIEVHSTLGGGFLEKVYENALRTELQACGIPAIQQKTIEVLYKGNVVGFYVADLVVASTVICEIKATDSISPIHQAQLLNYLRATGTKVGLLLNFANRRLEWRRMVY
jgi:GxxExxY protein